MTEPDPATSCSPHDARDAALLGRISAGERAAFEALYRAYYTRLDRFLRRMLRRPAQRPTSKRYDATTSDRCS